VQNLKTILIIIGAMIVTGCVTTTDSRFAKKTNEAQALTNYVALGRAYLSKGDFQKARQSFERALKINDEDASVHNALASLWVAEDEPELAEEHFEDALSYDDDFTEGKHRYGLFLFSQARYEKACELLNDASEDARYILRAKVFDDLALCQYRAEDVEGAISSYKKSLRLDRSNVTAMISLSTLLYDKKDMDGSARYFKRFQTLVDESQTTHTAQTLWLGIKLARVSKDKNQESSFLLQLKSRHADSAQHKLYKETR
jgi:type IV pilus assembly protein PilF